MIQTGYSELDRLLGGGWPRGHISEIMGEEGVGKSSLLIATARAAKKAGVRVAVVDFDGRGAWDHLKKDLGLASYTLTNDLESGLEVLGIQVRSGRYGLVVGDGLSSGYGHEGRLFGERARLITTSLQTLDVDAGKSGTSLVLISKGLTCAALQYRAATRVEISLLGSGIEVLVRKSAASPIGEAVTLSPDEGSP